jgi:dienelactone hydrolase
MYPSKKIKENVMRSIYEYTDGDTVFEGYLAIDSNQQTKRPCVLVAHAWDGPNDHFNALAEDLSKKGFVGFAIDVYGRNNRGKIDGDNSHLMNPLMENRALLRKRLLAAFTEMQKHPLVLPNEIAIMGYCFGGLCALDLARANPPGLQGAISIHGVLVPPNLGVQSKIDASILVLHGWEDSIVPLQTVLDFTQEMTQAAVDWQMHCYGHAKHAFTFVGADIPKYGIKYDEKACRRSQRSTDDFFREIFKQQELNNE